MCLVILAEDHQSEASVDGVSHLELLATKFIIAQVHRTVCYTCYLGTIEICYAF
jgi:hypothetical protein